MTETSSSLVGDILRACAAAAPRPWPPAAFIQARPEPRDDVIQCLDGLCRIGALRIERDPNNEPVGFTLTPEGTELAHDPQAIARFVDDERLDFSQPDTPQRRAIREQFRTPLKPYLNRILFWMNIAVFAWGCFLAWKQRLFSEFLNPMPLQGRAAFDVSQILLQTGMLSRVDILAGHWWKLLTSGFVHIGVLHLAMNMYALRILGSDSEWIWGKWRYLVLYLLAILGGSTAAVMDAPQIAGASGGLCGLLAAEGAWLILNRNYLPRRMVRRQLKGLLINGVLITLVSLIPGVSGAGHLGGAVAGLLAAILLHYQRFGSALLSKLAVVGLIGMPAVCVVGLKQVTSKPEWQRSEKELERERMQQLIEPMTEDYNVGIKFTQDRLRDLLEQHPLRRDKDDLQTALDKLPAETRRAGLAEERLSKSPPFRTQTFEEYRLAGQAYFRQFARFLSRVQECLSRKADWDSDKEEEELVRAKKRWVQANRAIH
jgi:membrane associated rhomboid family serine protease